MYSQGAAILRSDLRGVMEEAFMWEQGLIGAQALPPLPVTAKASQYPTIKRAAGNLLRNEVKGRGPSGSYPRVSRATENDNYTCQEYGLEEAVDDSQKKDASRFFDMESKAVKNVTRQLKLAHELRAKSTLFDRSQWTATTSATAYSASNLATFDVALDLDVVKDQIISRGESASGLSLVMSKNIFNLLRASTRLQNRIRGTISTDALLTLSAKAMADALEVKEILVGANAYDISKQGQSASMSKVWTDDNIWVGQIAPAAGVEQYFSGGAAYTLFWQEDGDIWQTESYREEDIRSTIIRCRHATAEKIVNVNAGYLLATQA